MIDNILKFHNRSLSFAKFKVDKGLFDLKEIINQKSSNIQKKTKDFLTLGYIEDLRLNTEEREKLAVEVKKYINMQGLFNGCKSPKTKSPSNKKHSLLFKKNVELLRNSTSSYISQRNSKISSSEKIDKIIHGYTNSGKHFINNNYINFDSMKNSDNRESKQKLSLRNVDMSNDSLSSFNYNSVRKFSVDDYKALLAKEGIGIKKFGENKININNNEINLKKVLNKLSLSCSGSIDFNKIKSSSNISRFSLGNNSFNKNSILSNKRKTSSVGYKNYFKYVEPGIHMPLTAKNKDNKSIILKLDNKETEEIDNEQENMTLKLNKEAEEEINKSEQLSLFENKFKNSVKDKDADSIIRKEQSRNIRGESYSIENKENTEEIMDYPTGARSKISDFRYQTVRNNATSASKMPIITHTARPLSGAHSSNFFYKTLSKNLSNTLLSAERINQFLVPLAENEIFINNDKNETVGNNGLLNVLDLKHSLSKDKKLALVKDKYTKKVNVMSKSCANIVTFCDPVSILGDEEYLKRQKLIRKKYPEVEREAGIMLLPEHKDFSKRNEILNKNYKKMQKLTFRIIRSHEIIRRTLDSLNVGN